MSKDKHSISGWKEWAVRKGVDYLQKKIKEKDLDEVIDKIDDTFTDKGSLSVLKALQLLISRLFLRINIRVRELQDGKVKPRYEENPELHKKPKKSLRRRFKN